MEKSHIDDALDNSSKAPNIKPVQSPSPPSRDWKKTYKTVAMLAFGGILAGLAWAFLIELVLDRSLRRPVEIEAKLKVPLFLSIPDVNRNGHARLAKTSERRQLQLNNSSKAAKADAPAGGDDSSPAKSGALQVVSPERIPVLQSFYESLRDRLIVYFEVKNLTHKPKLLAVTSAGHGAGVSSIAAGLAASLSETGDGNVLLVDMNVEQGAAQQFYKGKAGCGLDTALKIETQGDALVQVKPLCRQRQRQQQRASGHPAETVQRLGAQTQGQQLRLHHFRHAARQPDQPHLAPLPVHGHDAARR